MSTQNVQGLQVEMHCIASIYEYELDVDLTNIHCIANLSIYLKRWHHLFNPTALGLHTVLVEEHVSHIRQGQIRSKGPKQHAFSKICGNRRIRRRAKQTRYGCKVCSVAICNDENCWYFYHRID